MGASVYYKQTLIKFTMAIPLIIFILLIVGGGFVVFYKKKQS
jgi:LPXTG-motif cell wall-anchored protein